ncbi:MAG: bifunctional 5,10-methylenetetrahydrofolate dehydrogenase/5,10-methenyltetrahydrofolate cyclohydrolase [Coriobacteriales bacterium]|jgi:methylenetetrahydrofolate dehydrogenase (NADP+)/methenyltetrahydrofolate cyclohydrolase|nr:bifunctional 5,10-methylenetetrahydrofolate dehydrogenase/5,10-methenyltetrahydrofolate cyclohydrolase [Coriobacteriales bacterium]
MAQLLKGAAVVEVMNEATANAVDALKARGITPTLAIVRVGEREDEIAYERGAMKRCEKVGVAARQVTLPGDCTQDGLVAAIEGLNRDATVHGVLLLRPLPAHIDDDMVRNVLDPRKDIDGITDASVAGVFTNDGNGFAPCTPQACMEVLDYYGVDLQGKRAVVVGRSLVVGKPAAMMLLERNATVMVCHSRSLDLPALCRTADVIIACVGRPAMLDATCLAPGQTVIDVGINVLDDGTLVGDVDFAAAKDVVAALTPVPGGVGTVTTSVLVKHVVEAAQVL